MSLLPCDCYHRLHIHPFFPIPVLHPLSYLPLLPISLIPHILSLDLFRLRFVVFHCYAADVLSLIHYSLYLSIHGSHRIRSTAFLGTFQFTDSRCCKRSCRVMSLELVLHSAGRRRLCAICLHPIAYNESSDFFHWNMRTNRFNERSASCNV